MFWKAMSVETMVDEGLGKMHSNGVWVSMVFRLVLGMAM